MAGDNHIAVIDTQKLTLVRRIPTGAFPCDLDTTPDGRYVFTPERNQDTVAQIDLRTFQVSRRISLGRGSWPHMLRVSPGGDRVWVQTARGNTNTFPGAADLSLLKTISVGRIPVTNAFRPDGRVSYITNLGDGTISVVDTQRMTEIARIPVGPGPGVVGFSADGRFAFVSLRGRNAVAVLDARAHRVLKYIPAGKGPSGLLVTDRLGP